MATPVATGLLLCASADRRSATPVARRTPRPSARSVFGTRRDVRPGRFLTRPAPSPAPACQRARPRSLGQPRHGRCGFRRFTRPIWPPVPRSGVAPLRSPQSLPYVRLPVKGSGTVSLRSAFPRKGRTKELSPVSRETLQAASIQLREPHQFTTPPLLCQVGCRGSLFAPRIA
jgi:hypothetical protein